MHVTRRFCPDCGQQRPFEKRTRNHVLHLLLTVFTFGIWLPIWLLLMLATMVTPYRCRECGKARY